MPSFSRTGNKQGRVFLLLSFNSDTLILAAALLVFLIVGYKALDVLRNVLIIAFLAAVFPYVLRYFGLDFSTALNSELSYVVAGIGLYIIYELVMIALKAGGAVWEIAKLAALPFVWLGELLESVFKRKKKEERNETQKESGKKKEKNEEN